MPQREDAVAPGGDAVSDEESIQRIVETIRDEYHPERIILFGSRVWGEPHRDSDLDIFIIKKTDKREVERMREVARLVRQFQQWPYRMPIEVLVKTPQDIEKRLKMGDDFVRRILTEGRVVYDRRMV